MKPFIVLAAFLALVTGCAHISAGPRADFSRLVNRPSVALAPQVGATVITNGLALYHFSFSSDADDRVPGILIEPLNFTGRRPVVITMHGTGGDKEGMIPLCRKLAERGFIAVAIDGRYHGERKSGKNDYNDAIVKKYRGGEGHPFYYDTVFDVMRLVDYLQTRYDVDAHRIGLIGISKGGIETYLTAAMDKRIAVAVPCIGMQSFEWALENNDWQGRINTIQNAFDTITKSEGVTKPDSAYVQKFYDRVIPGIYSEFDGPQCIALIAPRPLLFINSDSDVHTPVAGVQVCVDAAKKIYSAENSDDKFSFIIQPSTGHKVLPQSEQAAIDWFVKWLKP